MKDSEVIENVNRILKKYFPNGFKLLLFGSRSTKKNSPNADFDFLIDAGSQIDIKTWASLREDLDRLNTLYSIDMTDLYIADSQFLETIKGDLIDVSKR